jgi:hypothetical protein
MSLYGRNRRSGTCSRKVFRVLFAFTDVLENNLLLRSPCADGNSLIAVWTRDEPVVDQS